MPNLTVHKYPYPVNFSLNHVPVVIHKDDVDVRFMVTRLLMEEVYLSNTYTEVGALKAFPDADNEGYFDFGGTNPQESALHAFFSGPDFPFADTVVITECVESIRRFKLQYDWYNFTGGLSTESTSAVFKIIMGGVPFEQFPTAGFWPYFYPANPRFLTWQPNYSIVSQEQKHWLYFYVTRTPVIDARVNWTIYYTDGTTQQGSSATIAADTGKLYRAMAGFTQLGLDLIEPTKTPYKYEVEVAKVALSGTREFSELRTFMLDNSYQPNARFFSFKNSIGGVDPLRTRGTAETSAETERKIVGRTQRYDYSVLDGQRKNILAQEQIKIHINSGAITKQEADFYRDMFRSQNIVEHINDRFLPVEILSKSVKIDKDNADYRVVEFDYQYAFDNPVFANESINSIPDGFSESDENENFPVPDDPLPD